MVRFDILLESLKDLKCKWNAELSKPKPNQKTIIVLKDRVDKLRVKMDKYGADGTLIEFTIKVKDSSEPSRQGVVKMYLSGLCEKNKEQWEPILKYRLAKYKLTYLELISYQMTALGTLQPY